jgi:hypothetical protein
MEAITFLVIVFAVYFFPWIVAAIKENRNTTAIAVLNLFLGWTLIGWVIALVWACTNEKSQGGTQAAR